MEHTQDTLALTVTQTVVLHRACLCVGLSIFLGLSISPAASLPIHSAPPHSPLDCSLPGPSTLLAQGLGTCCVLCLACLCLDIALLGRASRSCTSSNGPACPHQLTGQPLFLTRLNFFFPMVVVTSDIYILFSAPRPHLSLEYQLPERRRFGGSCHCSAPISQNSSRCMIHV